MAKIREDVNIFTRVDRSTYHALMKISAMSALQRRDVYRLALQYATKSIEFWGDLDVADFCHPADLINGGTAYTLTIERLKECQEKETAPSQ
jgi:hypothetical protein